MAHSGAHPCIGSDEKQTSMTFTIEQEADPASPDKPTPVAWTMFPGSFKCDTFPYTRCIDLSGGTTRRGEEGYWSEKCRGSLRSSLFQKMKLYTFHSVFQWREMEKNHGCFFSKSYSRYTPERAKKMKEFVLSTDFQKEKIIFIQGDHFNVACTSTYDSAFSIYHLNGIDYFAYIKDDEWCEDTDNDMVYIQFHYPYYYMLRVESTRKIRILHLKQ